MNEQQLELTADRKRVLRSTPEKLAEILLSLLEADGKWMNRADLGAFGFTPRECRLARQHSHGRIISGQLGYKASRNATREELSTAANTLMSQARVMSDGASEIWAYIHKGFDQQEGRTA